MKKTRRVLAIVLATIMVLTLIPMSAFAADNTIALGETKTIHIPEEDMATCKFTPEKDGIYVVYSDMGENDIDPYVSVCDEDGNEIAFDDDNDYYNTYDFYCIFEAEAGGEYWFEMIDLDGCEVTFDVAVAVYGEIEHQPTIAEPYVGVTEGADAEYQWYKIGDSLAEVTDENADPCEGEYGSGEYATYDSENGWTGVLYDVVGSYNEYNFFNVMLLEGNTIRMTADSYASRFCVWCDCGDYNEYWENLDANDTVEIVADHICNYNTYGDYENVPHLKAEMSETAKANEGAELEAEEAGTYVCVVTFDGTRYEFSDEVVILTEIKLNEITTISLNSDNSETYLFKPEKSGIYVIISDNGGNDDSIDPYVTVYDRKYEYVADDDDNDYSDTYNFYCIFEATAGDTYFIEFDGYDCGYEYDVVIINYSEITHQPTVDEPYVGVTEGADVEYQWFKVGGIIEVNEENTKDVSYSGNKASYDPEKGWTGIPSGHINGDYAEYDFFELELKEGQTLAMTFDCDMSDFDVECVGECDSYEYFDWDDIEAGETVYFTANHDCYFCCYGESDTVPVMKAVILDAIKIDGATDAEYKAKEIGEYFCRVTFDGCRIESSDKIEINESDLIPDSNKISKADVNVRTDIAGMNAYDYEDYIEILTKGLEFEDNYGDMAVYVYDSDDNDVYGEFVSGETYRVYLYLTPESGYKFANTVDGTVNGEEVETDVRYWEPGGEYGDVKVDFVELIFEITVTESCDHMCHKGGFLGFFWNIINFFNRLFGLNPICGCGAAHF